MNSRTERLGLEGPVGHIEVLRDRPESGEACESRGVAVVAHPHPLHGGTMDNKVVQTLARGFVASGWDAVRFNFRGVGASEGCYDEGRGETEDLLAVVERYAPQGPLMLAGFSFGSYVVCEALERLHTEREIKSLLLVGAAASRFNLRVLPEALRDVTLVVHGEFDDTVPLSAVMDWARPQGLPVAVVPGGGHFFHGQLPLLKGMVVRHVRGCIYA